MFSATAYPSVTDQEAYGGTVVWSDPDNVFADDGAVAAATPLTVGEISQLLKCTGFGFTIPAEALVVGLVVSANAWASAASKVKDNAVRLLLAGAVVGDDIKRAATDLWATANTTIRTWGGTSVSAGRQFTPAEINLATFGVGIQVAGVAVGFYAASIDYVAVTVYYEYPRSMLDCMGRMGLDDR